MLDWLRARLTVCLERAFEGVHPLLGLALGPAGDEQVAARVDDGQRLGRVRAEYTAVHVPPAVHQHHLGQVTRGQLRLPGVTAGQFRSPEGTADRVRSPEVTAGQVISPEAAVGQLRSP